MTCKIRYWGRAAAAALFFSLMMWLRCMAADDYEIGYGAEEKTDGTVSVFVSLFSSASEDISIRIPSELDGKKVTGIAEGAFEFGMGAIRKITVPSGVRTIGARAFAGCSGLEEIILPDGLKEIGEGAFAGCESLQHLALPDSVEKIGDGALDCPGLDAIGVGDCKGFSLRNGVLYSKDEKTLVWYPRRRISSTYRIPAGTTKIAACAFAGNERLREIILPKSVSQIGQRAFAGAQLEKITVAEESKNFTADRGVLYSADKLTLVAYPAARSTRLYSAPETLTMISPYAFENASVTHVLLPESLGYIGPGAFKGCAGLKRVTLPDGITEIGGGAFMGCTSLETAHLPEGGGLDRISEECFQGCTALRSVVIPEGIGYVCYGAFSGCSALEEVTIPFSAQYVDEDAFDEDCGALFTVTRDSPGESFVHWQKFAYRTQEPPEINRIYTDRETIRRVQHALNEQKYDAGKEDGVSGRNTKKAIREYRADKGLPEGEEIDDVLLKSLHLTAGTD